MHDSKEDWEEIRVTNMHFDNDVALNLQESTKIILQFIELIRAFLLASTCVLGANVTR